MALGKKDQPSLPTQKDLPVLRQKVLAAAEKILKVYHDFQQPLTPYWQNELMCKLLCAVEDLFELCKANMLFSTVGGFVNDLAGVCRATDAGLALSREKNLDAPHNLDLRSQTFQQLFGDLAAAAQHLRDEMGALTGRSHVQEASALGQPGRPRIYSAAILNFIRQQKAQGDQNRVLLKDPKRAAIATFLVDAGHWQLEERPPRSRQGSSAP
jgi:hypothetical protein